MSAIYHMTASELRRSNFRPIHAGDDYNHRFRVKRNDIILDLTGSTIWMTVKDSTTQTDSQAYLQLSSASSSEIEITGPTAGEFTVKFRGTGAKTTENIEGLWDYDIQVKLSGGDILTIAAGKIEFLPNLTRATT